LVNETLLAVVNTSIDSVATVGTTPIHTDLQLSGHIELVVPVVTTGVGGQTTDVAIMLIIVVFRPKHTQRPAVRLLRTTVPRTDAWLLSVYLRNLALHAPRGCGDNTETMLFYAILMTMNNEEFLTLAFIMRYLIYIAIAKRNCRDRVFFAIPKFVSPLK